MIDRVLRRLSVRNRIVTSVIMLVVLVVLLVPLVIVTRNFIVGQLRRIAEVEEANRSLLLASSRVESSRVNLMRYIQDLAPSAYEALDDVDQADQLLAEAEGLVTAPEILDPLAEVRAGLEEYRALISQVETARQMGNEQDVSRLLFQAYRLGNDIGQRIEQIVGDSEARIALTNQAFYATLQNRILLVVGVLVILVILALVLSSAIQRSITRPIADLRRGAEAFSQGQMDATIPVAGSDELTLLAETFNQMAAQIRDLVVSLEQQVADRTRDLERRAVQLATAADVGRAAASILDLEMLTRRVVDLARERFDLYYAGLFLLDETGRYAALEAGTGEAGRLMKQDGHRLEVGGSSMVGSACARREARIALDVGAEPVRFDNPHLPDTRSEMALPLVVGDRVLGALDVQSAEPAAFAEEDIAVLQLVANQVAVAIQNARLFSETEAALEAERRLYGELGLAAWETLARSQPHVGYQSDEQGVFPLRRERDTALDAPGTSAEHRDGESLVTPIKIREQVIGFIEAQKPEDGAGWTAQDQALLQVMIDQLGTALDSARLYQETQRRAAEEQLTGEITARIRESLDLETVLRTAAREIRQVLSLAEVEVCLSDELISKGGGQDGGTGEGLAGPGSPET